MELMSVNRNRKVRERKLSFLQDGPAAAGSPTFFRDMRTLRTVSRHPPPCSRENSPPPRSFSVDFLILGRLPWGYRSYGDLKSCRSLAEMLVSSASELSVF